MESPPRTPVMVNTLSCAPLFPVAQPKPVLGQFSCGWVRGDRTKRTHRCRLASLARLRRLRLDEIIARRRAQRLFPGCSMDQTRPDLIPNPAVRRLSLYLRQLEG